MWTKRRLTRSVAPAAITVAAAKSGPVQAQKKIDRRSFNPLNRRRGGLPDAGGSGSGAAGPDPHNRRPSSSIP
jgi:hypothetical protein